MVVGVMAMDRPTYHVDPDSLRSVPCSKGPAGIYRNGTSTPLQLYPSLSHLFHDICHVANVCGNDERGAHDAPEAELCLVLGLSHPRTVLQGFVIITTLKSEREMVAFVQMYWEGTSCSIKDQATCRVLSH